MTRRSRTRRAPRMPFAEQRAALIQYLRHKVEIADWHAVRDCAVDIELLEAKERGRNERKRTREPPVKREGERL